MRSATVRTSADPGDVCAQNGLIWAVSKMIAEELPAERNGGSARGYPEPAPLAILATRRAGSGQAGMFSLSRKGAWCLRFRAAAARVGGS